ncbi:lipoprotein signal peptidase, signal peptidase type II [Streptococcus pneumoniae]|nr:lipoprotein signal peptidase, signal peptidase type II [Streptococcus pneumoniae]
MKKRAIVAVIVLLLIGLDQLVKSYIVQQIPLGEVRSWIPNFVSLTYLQNRGAAFSILIEVQPFLSYKISSCYSLSLLWLS